MQCYKVSYSAANVWISLKMLCLPVLASFANAKLLDFSPNNTQRSTYTQSHAMLYVAHALGTAVVLYSVSVHDVCLLPR